MDRADLKMRLAEVKITNTLGQAARGWREKIAQSRLEADIIDATSYLSASCDISERLMNIRLNITELPRCIRCNSSLEGQIWKSKLCYLSFCSKACHHAHVTEKRIETMLADGSKIAKATAAKSAKTQRMTGSLDRRIAAALATKRAAGQCVPEELMPEHRRYKREVRKVTSRQPLHTLPNYEKRGFVNDDGWHIDHMYSISEGFKNGVPPEIIGHIANLVMLPGALNVKKQGGCSITLKQLRQRVRSHRSSQPASPATSSDHLPARR
jgi:hypothetical protein